MKKEEVIAAVRDALADRNIRYKEYVATGEMITVGSFVLNSKLKTAEIVLGFNEKGFNVVAYAPLLADDKCYDEMSKFLFMANCRSIIGAFVIQPETDRIFFRHRICTLWRENLRKEEVIEAISLVCTYIDHFGDGIAAIAFGVSDAETEMKKLEAKQSLK